MAVIFLNLPVPLERLREVACVIRAGMVFSLDAEWTRTEGRPEVTLATLAGLEEWLAIAKQMYEQEPELPCLGRQEFEGYLYQTHYDRRDVEAARNLISSLVEQRGGHRRTEILDVARRLLTALLAGEEIRVLPKEAPSV